MKMAAMLQSIDWRGLIPVGLDQDFYDKTILWKIEKNIQTIKILRRFQIF